ncbi:MAG TPA: ribonucleotide reductase N-terminal alpha domain-containing protein, partial [Hyphomicrobiaceae bacterium]|nr:ribonucleotide reductase N-terminal alpha domain-containing protein [Hyphomicrobiaceae bacterium]
MVSGVAQPGLNPSHPDPFEIVPVSRHIWETKYRFDGDATGRPGDHSISGTWKRIAVAAAAAEQPGSRADWAERFEAALSEFVFLPGGRIIAGAGTGRAVTLFNCFVMGDTADDLGAIFDGVKDAALTMQQGGGIGQDFSTLRPKGAVVQTLGADASGPVSFMDVWDAMCRTIMSAGARRGAMMGTLRCDHPDIEQFIAAKSDPTRLRNFNLSVLVTDTFIKAVREDQPWD